MDAIARIFVSYSRRDLAFVDELDALLRARGVELLIDRAEIYAFEDWWTRIQDLIASADTIVFVLSPDAIASEVCAREVAFGAALNKRFAPVVARAVDPAGVPAELSRLNFIHLDDRQTLQAGVDRLVEALSTDISWIRRHSEFGELARRWAVAGRPGPQGMLLRSPLLEDAERWIATRPANAPVPTEDAQSLILASRGAATRRRQIISGVLAVGLILALALSGLAFWQRQRAVENERLALAAQAAEAEQRQLAVTRERQAVEARDRTLVGQSRFLADLAARSLAEGDNGTAALFSLEALPDAASGVDRPLVPEAERGLDRALATLAERGLAVRHVGLSLGFSPDGRWAVSYGGGEQVLSDLTDGTTSRTPLAGDVVAFAFSPDGSRLARCFKGEIELVELAGDPPPQRVDPTRDGTLAGDTLRSCRFGPDGREVRAVGSGGRVGRWDVETGAALGRFTLPDGSGGLSFSADGNRLASLAGDGVVRVFDAGSGREVAAFPGSAAEALDIDRDGGRVLTTSADGPASIWDVASAKTIAELPAAGRSGLLSPEGDVVALRDRPRGGSGVGGGFELWDVATGRKLAGVNASLRLTSLAFAADGTRVVAGSLDGSLHVIETRTGRTLQRLVGHGSRVIAAALGPGGRRVLSSAFDSRLVLWTVGATRPFRELQVARAAVSGVHPLEGGRRLLVGSADGSLRVRDATDGRVVADLAGGGAPIVAVASAPAAGRALAFRQDGTAFLSNLNSGAVVASFGEVVSPQGVDAAAAGAVFSPGEDGFVMRLGPDTVSLRRSSDGSEIWRSRVDLDLLAGAFVTPEGSRVVAWSEAGTAAILDAGTGARLATIRNTALGPDGHELPEAAGRGTLPWSTLRASPDGRRLVTDGPLQPRVWALATGETERLLFEHQISGDRVIMRFGPNSDVLFTVEAGRTVTLWDLASGTRIRSFVGHGGPITSLRVSPDGRRLLTASEDGTARSWDVESGVELASLAGPAGPVPDARFWPDGQIATASSDGAVRFWPIARDAQALVERGKLAISRCLTPAQRRRAFLDPAPPAWCVTGPGRERDPDPQNWQPRPPYHTLMWQRWYRAGQNGRPVSFPQAD